MTSLKDYQTAVDRLLALTQRELLIYDHNLALFRLETRSGIEALKNILKHSPLTICLRMAVRDSRHVREASPRLLDLLRGHSHRILLHETAENLSHLRDSVLIADQSHTLVLFEQEQARSTLILDDPTGTRCHVLRFEEIWQSGSQPIQVTPLGL